MNKRVMKKMAAEAFVKVFIEVLAGMFVAAGVLGLFLAGKSDHPWITLSLWLCIGGFLCVWLEKRGF